MKFNIEQIALYSRNPEAAIALLEEMGADFAVSDRVTAEGDVFGSFAINTAELDFDYKLLEQSRELEVLGYIDGPNWMNGQGHRVSHFGTHCSNEELSKWRQFFSDRNIGVAQEVTTTRHSNDHGMRYRYVIFNTFEILGVDLKFIVRRDNVE